jgi:hypothetical protein
MLQAVKPGLCFEGVRGATPSLDDAIGRYFRVGAKLGCDPQV